jgi:hypothetical protein
MDPYKYMKLDYDCSMSDLRRQFRKLALKYHPDKLGDEKRFDMLKKSYQEIYIQLQEEIKLEKKQNSCVKPKKYKELNLNKQKKDTILNPKKFDNKKFNKIFNKFKIEEVDDMGYQNDMEKSTTNREDIYELNKKKIKQFKENKLVVYEDPTGYSDNKLQFKELGVKKRKNYNNNTTIKSSYQDYKDAYQEKPISRENDYLEKNNLIRGDYRDIDELRNQRSRISYNMSEEDKLKLKLKEKKEKIRERKRQMHLQQHDKEVEKRFNQLQNLISM